MTLRAIADATRISVAVLDSLERDDFSRLPGGIFSRGFVRAYAVEVGLNPDTTVEDFVRSLPSGPPAVGGHTTSVRYEDLDGFDGTRRAASLGLTLAVISAPLVVLIIYLGIAGWPWRDRPVAPAVPPAALANSEKPVTPTVPAR